MLLRDLTRTRARKRAPSALRSRCWLLSRVQSAFSQRLGFRSSPSACSARSSSRRRVRARRTAHTTPRPRQRARRRSRLLRALVVTHQHTQPRLTSARAMPALLRQSLTHTLGSAARTPQTVHAQRARRRLRLRLHIATALAAATHQTLCRAGCLQPPQFSCPRTPLRLRSLRRPNQQRPLGLRATRARRAPPSQWPSRVRRRRSGHRPTRTRAPLRTLYGLQELLSAQRQAGVRPLRVATLRLAWLPHNLRFVLLDVHSSSTNVLVHCTLYEYMYCVLATFD